MIFGLTSSIKADINRIIRRKLTNECKKKKQIKLKTKILNLLNSITRSNVQIFSV